MILRKTSSLSINKTKERMAKPKLC